MFVCPGTYIEGGGDHGENALTIKKDVNLVGAGADKVMVEPKNDPKSDGRIAEDNPSIRSGKGVIIAAVGKPDKPITVNIVGITVDANGVYATAGVVFLDARGSINRSRVTGLAIDESAEGFNVPGGFRSNPYGIGIAHVTAAPKKGHAINPAGSRAHAHDRPHARRHVQRDRRARRRRDERLLAVHAPVGTARAFGRAQQGRPDERPDHRPQLVPELQRPDVAAARASRTRR